MLLLYHISVKLLSSIVKEKEKEIKSKRKLHIISYKHLISI